MLTNNYFNTYYDTESGLRNANSLHQELTQNEYQGIVLFNIDNYNILNKSYSNQTMKNFIKEFIYFIESIIFKEPIELFRVSHNQFAFIAYKKENSFYEDIILEIIKRVAQNNFNILKKTTPLLTFGISLKYEQNLLFDTVNIALSHALKHKKAYSIYTHNIKTNKEKQNKLLNSVKNETFKPNVYNNKEIFYNTKINNFIKEFKEHGVKITLDNYRRDFSNLEKLINLNVAPIKIDASLTKKITF